MTVEDKLPILIGVGQIVSNWDGEEASQAPDPIGLCETAARRAIEDSAAEKAVTNLIDTIVVVRNNADSVAGTKHPFGRCDNPPLTVAERLGLSVENAIYSAVGGDQPQGLINEFAAKLNAGASTGVLLCGSEAIRVMRTARKKRLKLDWSDSADGPFEDRGLGTRLISDYEIKNGFGYPTQTYPAIEHALRHRLGKDRASYLEDISELFASFSGVASKNPYSQFPTKRSAQFLSTVSRENYPVADPYLKWHVAQDAVNQGAAVILTTPARARAAGVPKSKWIYLHGHSALTDAPVTERPDISRSRSIEGCLALALQTSGLGADDIDLFDIYSCFPCVVQIAAEALKLDWKTTCLTVTGGLPFFGGPGNNYSMHAIATMVERLREDPQQFGLILANGGFMSKHAVGVYSGTPPINWAPSDNKPLQTAIDRETGPELLTGDTVGEVETFTVTHGRHAPERGYVIARTPKGRVLAKVHSGHRATLKALAEATDPVGQEVKIVTERGANYIQPQDELGRTMQAEFLNRTYEHVLVNRSDHILEVTLNRPKAMNALHSAVHYELHEIFDTFERDPDLWVAIVTGAGDRAFCSGNDLKTTAAGGDMSIPRSGFAGLCSRFDREKPVIAAVNGIAMGGGLEIVLACDLAISSSASKFALPEVRVGLFAAAGGVQRLTRQIGRKAAMELILTGRHFDAQEALVHGIVNEICEPGGALEGARELANRILEVSPSAVRASKQALNALEKVEALEVAMQANATIFGRLMKTRDFTEGVTAFAEKRAPNWTNT